MDLTKTINVGLAGNPNSGKTSIFNILTGLNQKIANYPGVTVEKKSGRFKLSNGQSVNLTDYPGAYSLHATTQDERVFTSILTGNNKSEHPDLIIYVVNSTYAERQLLMATQIIDIGIPVLLVFSMSDETRLDNKLVSRISKIFKTPTVLVSSKDGAGIEALKELISQMSARGFKNEGPVLFEKEAYVEAVAVESPGVNSKMNDFRDFIRVIGESKNLGGADKAKAYKLEVWDTMNRFRLIESFGIQNIRKNYKGQRFSLGLDKILTHPVWGVLIFLVLLFLVFQSIFAWTEKPIEWIEILFNNAGAWMSNSLPDSWWSKLLVNGILPGLSGIFVFIPQIAMLFLWIALLEESGYMSRAVYLSDAVLRKFGLNGRSIISLLSGGACAIPAIMSARTIANSKERLITILVTPLISCSARLPVYTLMLLFIVPAGATLGIFNVRGLAFMGIYVFSTAMVLVLSYILKKIIKSDEPSQLMLELPDYRVPILKNVVQTVWEKVKTFITQAGKVIFVISIILWFLTSFGPERKREAALDEWRQEVSVDQKTIQTQTEASVLLENSYAGLLGKWIEPVITPLGYDWKIGIALIASFAAREVFVGTMATIYSAGEEESPEKLSQLLAKQINKNTGEPTFNRQTSISLIVFYIFAMQCLSTVAVVRKETNSWKWPLFQIGLYTLLAYVAAWIAYQF